MLAATVDNECSMRETMALEAVMRVACAKETGVVKGVLAILKWSAMN